MGSAKPIQRTEEIEDIFPLGLHDVNDACSRVRTSLNHLEARLAVDFPDINNETRAPNKTLRKAFYNYCMSLSEAASKEKIRESKPVPVYEDAHARLIPNFIRYLGGFGEVSISSCVCFSRDFERVGIFLTRKVDEPKLIGFLEIQQNPDQIEYFGYIPVNISSSEFFKVPVYQLSTPPDLWVNLIHARLFCETIDGKPVRIDGYGNKGIEFP